MHTCVYCGQPVYDDEMDFFAGGFAYRGTKYPMSPSRTTILRVLWKARPRVVPYETIMDHVYGYDRPSSDTLKVHLTKMRKLLKRFEVDFSIVTHPGWGLSIEDGRTQPLTTNPKLTPDDVRAIKKSHLSASETAAMWDVSVPLIRKIRKGTLWASVQ